MRDDEREMLRGSLARLLAETDNAGLPAALAGFGWLELLDSEPHEAVPALFEAQGENLTTSPMLDWVLAPPLSTGSDRPATGNGRTAVVLPGPGSGADPRSILTADVVEVDGYGLAGATGAARLLVAARRGEELVIAEVVMDGALGARPVDGIDPGMALVRLAGRLPVAELRDGAEAVPAWEAAVAAGRRALAHELSGVSHRMLALALAHAHDRRQFGRPVGSFQAIKHRLAEAQVALTAAEGAAAEAWSGPEALSALLAKLWAGRAARLVGKQAQQVLGGMGFTWEHPFHLHFRRALLLDSLLGSTTELTRELGRSLVTGGEVPQLASL
ncbi:MAG: acyl-CoA dehydrogenase family protein [Acidimicrobiia bacterium]